jgi:hypothetical protein
MDRLLYVSGGLLFLGALTVQVAVRIWRKHNEPENEEVYWEFEDQDPDYARYTQWLRGSMICGCLGLLFLFLAIAL